MKKINLYKLVLALLSIGVISSCKKIVDIPDPIDTVTDHKIFQSDAQASQTINGIYAQMMLQSSKNFCFGFATIHGGLAADEFVLLSQVEFPSYVEISKNDINPQNENSYKELWMTAYKIMYSANAILDGEAKSESTNLTVAKREELKAHAKFIRAFCLFYLTGFYDKIPLTKSSKHNDLIKLSKSSQEEVYKSIVIDLEEAIQHFRLANLTFSKSKASELGAEALLARVYLYQKNWLKAKLHADHVITSGGLTLDSDLRKVFTKSSNEAIFMLIKDTTNPIASITDTEYLSPYIPFYEAIPDPFEQELFLDPMMFEQIAPLMFPIMEIGDPLMNAFEAGDLRSQIWIGHNPSPNATPYNGKKTYYANKYPKTVVYPDCYSVMRLTEQYLIRAEANAQLGLFDLVEDDLETIRHRAGLTNPLVLADKDAALMAVAKERQTELFAEWGHRFFDLKRTGKALEVLGQIPHKAGINPARLNFPIPHEEIIRNPRLGRD